jgi:hypothetical protein
VVSRRVVSRNKSNLLIGMGADMTHDTSATRGRSYPNTAYCATLPTELAHRIDLSSRRALIGLKATRVSRFSAVSFIISL